MIRRHLTTGLLLLAIGLTADLVVGSYVSYAPAIDSSEMQNIYLRRITNYGIAIVLLQAAALVSAFVDRRRAGARS